MQLIYTLIFTSPYRMIPRGVLPTLSPQRTCGERKTPYPSAVDSILRLLRIPNSWGWTCGVMLLGLTHIMVKAPRQFYRFTYHAISILCFTSIFFLSISPSPVFNSLKHFLIIYSHNCRLVSFLKLTQRYVVTFRTKHYESCDILVSKLRQLEGGD